MGIPGYVIDDIERGAKYSLADMLKRQKDPVGEYDQLVLKDPCDGPYNLHLGYKRVGLPRRWRFGDALPMTVTAVWSKKFYPVMYGLGAEMNIRDETELNDRMIRTVAEELSSDLINSLPEFNNQSMIDVLTGSTTMLEDGLDLLAYDGLNGFSSSSNRFGLSYGNIDNRFTGTSADNIVDQILGYMYDFRKMRDEHNRPFHRQQILAGDIMIIASIDYQRSWFEALRNNFFPKETATATVYSPTDNIIGKDIVGSPTVLFDSRLTGKDHYGFLMNNKFKPFVDTYHEFKSSPDNVLTTNNENPMPNSDGPTPGGSFFQMRRTRPEDMQTIKYGRGAIGLFFKKVRGIGRPQNMIKMDVA